jgi:hypothetical protein
MNVKLQGIEYKIVRLLHVSSSKFSFLTWKIIRVFLDASGSSWHHFKETGTHQEVLQLFVSLD